MFVSPLFVLSSYTAHCSSKKILQVLPGPNEHSIFSLVSEVSRTRDLGAHWSFHLPSWLANTFMICWQNTHSVAFHPYPWWDLCDLQPPLILPKHTYILLGKFYYARSVIDKHGRYSSFSCFVEQQTLLSEDSKDILVSLEVSIILFDEKQYFFHRTLFVCKRRHFLCCSIASVCFGSIHIYFSIPYTKPFAPFRLV